MSDEARGDAGAELDALDYYTLLGIEHDAERAAIRAAFRRFALRYHPDRFAGEAPERVARALTIYRRGAEAVEVLCDPRQRAAYDAVLKVGQRRLTDDAVTALRGLAAAKPREAPASPPSAAATPKPMPTFAKPTAGVRGTRPRPARASKPSRRAMAAVKPRVAPPAPAPLKSPQARAFLERAMDAKAEGDLKAAWRMLKAAVEAEPGNTQLESELYAVERTFRK